MKLVSNMTFTAEQANVYEYPSSVSHTVPNQALTVEQLIAGYTTDVRENPNLFYDNGEDFPDLRTMDLVEIHQYREDLREEIAELQTRLQEADQHIVDPSPVEAAKPPGADAPEADPV